WKSSSICFGCLAIAASPVCDHQVTSHLSQRCQQASAPRDEVYGSPGGFRRPATSSVRVPEAALSVAGFLALRKSSQGRRQRLPMLTSSSVDVRWRLSASVASRRRATPGGFLQSPPGKAV